MAKGEVAFVAAMMIALAMVAVLAILARQVVAAAAMRR